MACLNVGREAHGTDATWLTTMGNYSACEVVDSDVISNREGFLQIYMVLRL